MTDIDALAEVIGEYLSSCISEFAPGQFVINHDDFAQAILEAGYRKPPTVNELFDEITGAEELPDGRVSITVSKELLINIGQWPIRLNRVKHDQNELRTKLAAIITESEPLEESVDKVVDLFEEAGYRKQQKESDGK